MQEIKGTEVTKKPASGTQKSLATAFVVVAIAMFIYHLAYTQFLLQSPVHHRITHLGFALTIVFLSLLSQSKRGWWLKWGLLLTSVVVTGYFMLFIVGILRYRWVQLLPVDMVMAALILLVAFIGSYLLFGKTFVTLAALSLIYLILGRYLPFPFTVAPVSIQHLARWLAMPGLEEGIYGDILAISANYLFLFILFGSVLQAFAGTRFIMALGQWLGSKFRSGPAATAVFGSSLVGTVTGSTVANITIVGAFTIPMMKRVGYTPEQAGAIEAAASNGGQIMPPVMGAAAFVMSGITGIPYVQIAIAAVGPAIIYYLCVFLYVELTARRLNLNAQAAKVPLSSKQFLVDAPPFILPLVLIVILLARGYSLPFVGFWAIVCLVVIGLLNSLRKDARLNFKEVVKITTSGVREASGIAIISALIGVIATCITTSGLGMKLPMLIQDISGGRVFIALLIGAVASIILGMGVPTVAAYLLVAIGLSPALVKMGVPLLQAHMFPMIFAVFSHLTPPVAVGALVASRIAGGEYWKTCWEACKAAFTCFLLPFFIIYAPVIMFRPVGDTTVDAVTLIGLFLGIVSLQMALSNYAVILLQQKERLIFTIAALLSLVSVFSHSYPYLIAAAALFLMGIVWQLMRKRETDPIAGPE